MELSAIYYGGSESDWANVEIQSGNEILQSVTIQFNADIET
jgi:hypothetical protein